MSHKEEKIPNYIDFPYDIFLMLRLEFLALCQDELEAKIMRIIEKAINDEWERIYRERCAKTPKNEPVQMPDDVWAAIPNRYFMDRLLGTVQSETTLKAAMKSLIQKKRFIFRRDRSGRYEAPEYTLNKKALKAFFATLPADPRQLDIKIIMKQERKKTIKEGDQLLTPSKPDPIISERVKHWPHEHQLLTPSAPIIDPLLVLGGGQLLAPTYIYQDTNLNDYLDKSSAEETITAAIASETDVSSPTHLLTQEIASLFGGELPRTVPAPLAPITQQSQPASYRRNEENVPTLGEMPQAQQLPPVAGGCDDTPAAVGGIPATKTEGSAKGDASNTPATRVGGKREKPPKPEKPARQPKPAPLTPEEQLALEPEIVQSIVREWQGIFTQKPKPVTETMIKHAKTIAGYKPEQGEIIACRLWLYATDKNKYYDGFGMTLGTIASSFERFQSLAEKPVVTPKAAPEKPIPITGRYSRIAQSSFDDPNYPLEDEFYPVKEVSNAASF